MQLIYIIGIITLLIIAGRIALFLYENNQREKAKKEYESKIKEQIQEYDEQQKIEIYPYHAKRLLTRNEYYFYKEMKKITDQLGLQILAKIRLADLIEVDNQLKGAEWGRYFGKIKSKHIDFAITDDMRVIVLVELDDNSHNREDRIERDQFVNNALIHSGYIIVRTDGSLQPLTQALEDIGYN